MTSNLIRLLLPWPLLWSLPGGSAAERPNVIVVFTNDHGYADFGCQGVLNDVKTLIAEP